MCSFYLKIFFLTFFKLTKFQLVKFGETFQIFSLYFDFKETKHVNKNNYQTGTFSKYIILVKNASWCLGVEIKSYLYNFVKVCTIIYLQCLDKRYDMLHYFGMIKKNII